MRQLTNDFDKILFHREAAAVTRCHVVQKIGGYDNGQHSFNMLTMLRVLNPNASLNLVWAIVGHDLPERWTGDIPAPVKWYSPALCTTLAEMEERVYQAIGWVQPTLTEEEHRWLKGLDILELLLWAHFQALRGNVDAYAMVTRIKNYMNSNAHNYPGKIMHIVDNLLERGLRHYSVGELD